MRKFRLVFLIVIFTVKLFSQQSYMIKYFHRGYESLFNKVSDSIFVSMIETTNKDYRLFLDYLLETNQQEEYNLHLPKSYLWKDKVNYCFSDDYSMNYFSNVKFDNYPVVNISKESMDAYCEWLTQCYYKNGKKYSKIIVRLPSVEEWNKMANPNNYKYFPWGTNSVFVKCKKKKNCSDSCLIANIKVDNNNNTDNSIGVNVIAQFSSTLDIGFYDIIGNVAEMTQEHIVKGGSWDNLTYECYLKNVQNYKVPDPRVGFRILIEIIR